MILAGALLLVLAPLNVPPGVRTFPEIAALIAETPGSIKCEPKIAHRAAFVSAKAISRGGLLDALGLRLEADVRGRETLRATDEITERKWAEAFRAELSRQYDREVRYALAAVANGTGQRIDEERWSEEWDKYHEPLSDPKTSPEEKRRWTEAWSEWYARTMAADPAHVATTLVLGALPREVPMEVLEQGVSTLTVPLANLPAPAIAALRAAYPDLQGGPGAMVVRQILLVDDMRLFSVHLTLVDPSRCMSLEGGAGMDPRVGRSPEAKVSFVSELLMTEANGGLRMRGYRDFVDEMRAGEAEGRDLIARNVAEVPPTRDQTSLSQVAAAWAEKGRDVIMELSPKAEETALVLDAKGLRRESDWSPRVVEGALVLRPLTRFLDARRRYPYAALRACEEAQAAGKDGWAEYARLAGPSDRFAYANYHGWWRCRLDLQAAARRLGAIVPPEAFHLARERVEEVKSGTPVAGVWSLPLARLSSAAQKAVRDEFLWSWGEYENQFVLSDPAWNAFVAHAEIRVEVPSATATEAGVHVVPISEPGPPPTGFQPHLDGSWPLR